MAEAKIPLYNSNCNPVLDEDGNQVFINNSEVDLHWWENGDPKLDGCGHQIWTYKATTTKAPPPPPPPTLPPIYPPVFGPNKVNWKLIIWAIVVIGILGLLIS